ncbi:MAG: hypothetical protein ACR2PX_25070 [Endozoicomonas sp.]|uniref:hypothetical protein n=1 Tax=Endozoicomonas sp. TaxID=1892382 RepID=UPI003D9B9802
MSDIDLIKAQHKALRESVQSLLRAFDDLKKILLEEQAVIEAQRRLLNNSDSLKADATCK